MVARLARRSASGSVWPSSSMSRSWCSIRDWPRPDSSVNISLSLPRSPASLSASRSTSPCTWSKARATSPISSRAETPTALTASLRPSPSAWLACPRLMVRSASGSHTSVSSTAPARNWRSGRSTDLIRISADHSPATRMTAAKSRARMADTMAPSCMELTFASAEARRKAPAARMKPAVARAAAAAGTTASRPSRVRTSQFACGPPGSAAGASVPAPRCWRALSWRALSGRALSGRMPTGRAPSGRAPAGGAATATS